MTKAYLYLASDGVDDFRKFGITENLNSRLINYNTSEHLRPIFFEKVFEFDDYFIARNVETTLRNLLKNYIPQTNHIETFVWNEETRNIFNNFTKEFKSFHFRNIYIGNMQNEKYPYYEKTIDLINSALKNGVPKNKIEELVIKSKVGYFRENAPSRVVMENRIKHLIKLSERELCWDNKPSISVRMSRFYNLQDRINKIVKNANVSTV